MAEEPEARDRVRALLREIMTDEMGHVGQRRNFIGSVGIHAAQHDPAGASNVPFDLFVHEPGEPVRSAAQSEQVMAGRGGFLRQSPHREPRGTDLELESVEVEGPDGTRRVPLTSDL